MANTIKDTHTLECIRNLIQLLQTMAIQMEELERRTYKSQKLRKQCNCCEIKNHYCSINFSDHLVVVVEN